MDFVYAGKRYDPEQGVLRRCWLFVMTLGHSRHMHLDLVLDQRVETWCRLHLEAFEAFGGVPRVVVPDNLKSAVIRAAFGAHGEPSLNRTYASSPGTTASRSIRLHHGIRRRRARSSAAAAT